jgi:undecaprenyl-diphosphatase
MLHTGTLAAVFVVLWRDIWAILRRFFQPLTAYLAIATLPAVVFALVFKDMIERAFSSGKFLGFAFLITSALLTVSELLAKREKDGSTKNGAGFAGRMNWVDALIIGVLQAAAVIPGVSRSGATLSGALSRGLDRDFAARFSFLLSIPAILGALVLQVKELTEGAVATGNGAGIVETGNIGAAAIIAGTLSAAIVGFFAVRLMLKIIRERSLIGFAVYTAALGILVLIDQFGTHLVF